MLVGGAALVFDCGLSAEDLVAETLDAFFSSEKGLGWNPDKGSLATFLCGVLEKKFIDHRRRDRHVAGSVDDENFKHPGKLGDQGSDPHEELSYSEFADQMRSKVRDRKDLQDFITATQMTDGGHNVNQQLAEIMDTSVPEVVNRKKQLLRVHGIKKLYEERRTKEKDA